VLGVVVGVPGVAAVREGAATPASCPARCVPHPATSTASTAIGTIRRRTPVVLVIVIP
jgi:hypothetical protein